MDRTWFVPISLIAGMILFWVGYVAGGEAARSNVFLQRYFPCQEDEALVYSTHYDDLTECVNLDELSKAHYRIAHLN